MSRTKMNCVALTGALISVALRPVPANQTPKTEYSFSAHVGIAVRQGGVDCLGMRKGARPGRYVTLVILSKPQRIVRAALMPRMSGECADAGNSGLDFRPIRLPGDDLSEAGMAIAVYPAFRKFGTSGDYVRSDLDGDGVPEFFRSCASTEGIHFTVWSGKLLEGAPRWHQYYHLNYDLEPDCTAKDVAPASSGPTPARLRAGPGARR